MGIPLELVTGGAQRIRSAVSGRELDERGLAGFGAAVLLSVFTAPGLVLGGGETWRGAAGRRFSWPISDTVDESRHLPVCQ